MRIQTAHARQHRAGHLWRAAPTYSKMLLRDFRAPCTKQNIVRPPSSVAGWLFWISTTKRRTMRTGASAPEGWFDWKFYLRIHPDLQHAGMCTKEECIAHWLRHGQRENRNHRTLPAHEPHSARCSVGVVVATCGNNGVFVRQCIDSLYCHIHEELYDLHVVLYISECGDDLTLRMDTLFPRLRVVYVPDQNAQGDRTRAWNSGIHWLLRERRVDMVILSNDDVFVDSSLSHLLSECEACQTRKSAIEYFGPVTNDPGPALCNQWQQSTQPLDGPPKRARNMNLSGFFMALPRWVIEQSMFDARHAFDPSLSSEENEVAWFERAIAPHSHARSVVVPRAFVYHRKLRSWGSRPPLSRACVYTVNTGGYEASVLLDESHDNQDIPVYYFTDSERMVYEAAKKGLIPMRIYNPDGIPPKSIQRRIKAVPHAYLPHDEHVSVYVDGNCYFKPGSLVAALDAFERSHADIMCWAHPDRSSIRTEAPVVVQLGLETESNVTRVLAHARMRGFSREVDHVLTETNVLIRRHKAMIMASEEWARCIELCKRDQLSFDYVIHAHGVRVARRPFATKPVLKKPHSGNVQSREIRADVPPNLLAKANTQMHAHDKDLLPQPKSLACSTGLCT